MNNRTQVITIEKSLPYERLDAFLRSVFPVASRGAIQRLIEEGHITINGRKVKPTHTPRAGEVVTVCWPEAKPAQVQPEDMELDILFEDKALLVLNKAPGLVVHPSAGHREHTLVNALLHHCKGQLSGIGGIARPGIVHRLDKDTSGCLVVAKNDETHHALASQFANREVNKIYQTIVCGEVPRLSGEIRAGIARHPSHRKRMAVTEGAGREAWTSYQVLERLRGTTLLQALLHTGRTHQIRVHFQHLGFPLFGDETYGKRQTKRVAELTGYLPPRLMLHARLISFLHPTAGKKLTFEAPLPDDFRAAMKALSLR